MVRQRYEEKLVGKYRICIKKTIKLNDYCILHAGMEYNMIEFENDSGNRLYKFNDERTILGQVAKIRFADCINDIDFLEVPKYSKRYVEELCMKAYSDGYTDALSKKDLLQDKWIEENIK